MAIDGVAGRLASLFEWENPTRAFTALALLAAGGHVLGFFAVPHLVASSLSDATLAVLTAGVAVLFGLVALALFE